ncbi:MAG: hypothetical protein HKM87_11450 [Ignavibacteriaceae bacterium]|nr:hypothetical protein [Ignavibacteriaceae bacterium]
MLKIFLWCILLFLLSSQSFSLPRFAVRLGDKCIDCHYNPTGGLIRNDNGFFYGQNMLSLISPREKDFSMSPKLNDNVSIGLDLRGQFLYSQEKERTDFQRMTGSVYGRIGLSKKINILARYDFVNNIWEAFGVAQVLPNNSYIKAGSFQPNYGIRLDDHTAYTRGGDFFLLFQNGARTGLIYNPFYIEAGAELGIYISDFIFLTSSAGANLNNPTLTKDPTYTARLELTPSIGKIGFLLGGSYAAANVPQKTEMYGGFAGIGFDRFSLLAEYDQAKNLLEADINSSMLMVQAAYIIMVGLEAYARYDWLDKDIDRNTETIAHLILGFEFIPYSFIEIRPQYRFIIEDPVLNNDAVVIQFHFWY